MNLAAILSGALAGGADCRADSVAVGGAGSGSAKPPACGPTDGAEDPSATALGQVHRPITVDDLARVMAVEVQAYSHPWTRGNFADSLSAGYLTEALWAPGGGLVGYWVAMPGADELHLLNLTVAPALQRRGHGQALLARLVAAARQRGDRMLWLEVRQSNQGAQALYRQAGFEAVGLRRHYYPAERGREDAVVMRLAWSDGPDSAPGAAGEAAAPGQDGKAPDALD